MTDSAVISPGSTKEVLLLTALHLYAQEGLHAVSLRRISTAAGSKNATALHYHFDNKLGVIRALLEMIFAELACIDTTLRADAAESSSLRAAFRQTLQPLAQLPRERPWGDDALRFLSRVIGECDADTAQAINPLYAKFWYRIDEELASLAPNLPTETRRLRLIFMSTNVFHGFAEVNSLAFTPLGDFSHIDRREVLDHLVDYLIGGFKARSAGTTTINNPQE